MTAEVIPLRPRPARRPRPERRPGRPARPAASSPPVLPVSVEWSPERCAYVAVCSRCTDTALPVTLDDAEEWADTHTCDPELVALLDQVCGGRVA